MQARMKNPAMALGATPAIQEMMKTVFASGIDPATLNLVALRVGQMNECRLCIQDAMGKGDDRLDRVLDWATQDGFSAAERAALKVTEEATRLGKEYDSVTDETWNAAAALFDEGQMAGLVLMIGAMNLFTRLNVVTRQTTAEWA